MVKVRLIENFMSVLICPFSFKFYVYSYWFCYLLIFYLSFPWVCLLEIWFWFLIIWFFHWLFEFLLHSIVLFLFFTGTYLFTICTFWWFKVCSLFLAWTHYLINLFVHGFFLIYFFNLCYFTLYFSFLFQKIDWIFITLLFLFIFIFLWLFNFDLPLYSTQILTYLFLTKIL